MSIRKTAGAAALLFAFALVFTLSTDTAQAARYHGGGWALIGHASVSDARDHDVIPIKAARGTFRRVQVKVFERPVQFRAMTIHFGNGDDQRVELRDVIRPGRSSRVIDVDGHDRVIRSIEFRYDAQSRGHRAEVKVYGLS